MLNKYFDKTASTKRLQFVTEPSDDSPGFVVTDKKDFITYLTAIPCLVQPVDAEISQNIEEGFGKDFLMMCNITDIVETDRVIVDGLEYRIVGIERHSWIGHTHMELLIRIFRS